MALDKTFVKNKLKDLNIYCKEIEDLLRYSDSEILNDISKLRHAERSLQLCVDTMVDINQHFVRELNLPTSDDFQGTFLILAENAVLPKIFAEKISPVVGLRNRIVHRYEKLNKKLFLSEFRKNYKDFDEYVGYVYKYLKKK